MTGDAVDAFVELNEWAWQNFQRDLAGLTADETDWRPLRQANNISTILRHLRLEAEWHVACLERGEAMPAEVTESEQQAIDAVPMDFDDNLRQLNALYTRFNQALRRVTWTTLQQTTALAYRDFQAEGRLPPHFLGFHQAIHLAMHWGQIRTIRNLYSKARGEPARFFPENPTYPKSTEST